MREKKKLQHDMCQMPAVVEDAQRAECKAGQLGDWLNEQGIPQLLPRALLRQDSLGMLIVRKRMW